jgi:hypothetical protein
MLIANPNFAQTVRLRKASTMTLIKTAALAGFCAFAAFTAAVSSADASPLSGSNNIWNVWSSPTPGADASSASQQALPTAAQFLGTSKGTTYTGVLNFTDTTANTVGGFLDSDNPAGNFNGCGVACMAQTLSEGDFASATLFEFRFTLQSEIVLSIHHDDGVSIYNKADTINFLPVSSAAPTANGNDTVRLAAGTYDLWYSEVNGLPATLTTDVPEPASMAIFGAGLAGMGILTRRRHQSVRTRG